MSTKDKLKGFYKNLYLPFSHKRYHNKSMKKYLNCIPQARELTEKEKQDIKEFWGKYGLEDISYDAHKILYNKTGISDPKFVSPYVFYYQMKPSLNDLNFAVVWSDKNYLDYFLRGIDTVKSVVRNINGRFLDSDFNLITIEEAESIMNQYDKLVTKPTLLTSVGSGVELNYKPYNLKEINKIYKKNYVIQVPLKQHAFLDNLNSSTTNTMRINTILLEKEAYVVNSLVKVGEAGQFADNRGKNRYFLGFDKHGVMKDYCVDKHLNLYNSIPSGYDFAGQKIPHIDRVYKLACDAHKKLAHFGMVFWDIVLKDDGYPVILEANLRGPDLLFGQVACGPFFGEYTEEFLEYYKKKK